MAQPQPSRTVDADLANQCRPNPLARVHPPGVRGGPAASAAVVRLVPWGDVPPHHATHLGVWAAASQRPNATRPIDSPRRRGSARGSAERHPIGKGIPLRAGAPASLQISPTDTRRIDALIPRPLGSLQRRPERQHRRAARGVACPSRSDARRACVLARKPPVVLAIPDAGS